ncbi:MAG TPA: acylphosphatase [Pyrinomonadaceae bacterium]|nr:acylphosphatase [Pyrinomonadaceae bacterium]
MKAEKNTVSQRLRLTICGAVQGVGFRPFIYACAKSCALRGFVGNESGGVFVEIEGLENNLVNFQKLLRENASPRVRVISIEVEEIPATNETDFWIVESSKSRESENTLVSPDASVCDDCLRELFDENDRRFRYPFTNCTNCGTRFTIVKDISYDRPNTTMSRFQMCELCQSEYDNPLDRRFHAQPNTCPNCGASVSATSAHRVNRWERRWFRAKARAPLITITDALPIRKPLAQRLNERSIKFLAGDVRQSLRKFNV